MENNKLTIEGLKNTAKRFKAIANPMKVAIISMLDEEELNVTEIYKKLQVEQPVASIYLHELKHFGYVNARRDGKMTYYSLNEEVLVNILNLVDDFMG